MPVVKEASGRLRDVPGAPGLCVELDRIRCASGSGKMGGEHEAPSIRGFSAEVDEPAHRRWAGVHQKGRVHGWQATGPE